MKTLTQTGIEKIVARLAASLSHATYELDGEPTTIPLSNVTQEGSVLKVNIFFGNAIVGQIENIKLVDLDGDVVAESDRTFIKPLNRGFFAAFKYNLLEMEVEQIGV